MSELSMVKNAWRYSGILWNTEYDAILMDMQMPVMNGLEAARAIRKLNHPEARSIPIIALTANAYQEDMEACMAAGMNEHLAKPIRIEEVVQVLAKYL